MNIVTTSDGTQIFYKDWGPKDDRPIFFHHGWPLSSDDWDACSGPSVSGWVPTASSCRPTGPLLSSAPWSGSVFRT
jgi:pimeloyl-ACP methyl ester carboxylesterase